MRALIYVRQSMDRSGEALGVERQREDCVALAAARGWSVVDTITDNDTSATKGKRPGFARVLERVDARSVDAVVVWAADRLVRQLVDLEEVIARCERAGVRLATVSGDLDLSTDQGRLVARILASVARNEVERKGARQRRAYQQAAEQGLPHSGPRPFGFEEDRVTHREPEAKALREAYAKVLAGASLASIAREWNAAGLVTGRPRTGMRTRGRPSEWSAETVRVTLCRPRHAGLRERHGEVIGPGCWEPIVPEPTWRAVVALLTDPQRSPSKSARRLLSGLALCGVCSGPVEGNARRGEHAYRCLDRHFHRRGNEVDKYVTEVIVGVLGTPGIVESLVEDTGPDVGRLRDEAAGLRARLHTLAIGFGDGTVSETQLRTASGRARDRLAEVEAALVEAGRVDSLAPFAGARGAKALRAKWDNAGLDRQRAVIDTLATVTLHPAGRGARYFDPATVIITPKVQP